MRKQDAGFRSRSGRQPCPLPRDHCVHLDYLRPGGPWRSLLPGGGTTEATSGTAQPRTATRPCRSPRGSSFRQSRGVFPLKKLSWYRKMCPERLLPEYLKGGLDSDLHPLAGLLPSSPGTGSMVARKSALYESPTGSRNGGKGPFGERDRSRLKTSPILALSLSAPTLCLSVADWAETDGLLQVDHQAGNEALSNLRPVRASSAGGKNCSGHRRPHG